MEWRMGTGWGPQLRDKLNSPHLKQWTVRTEGAGMEGPTGSGGAEPGQG